MDGSMFISRHDLSFHFIFCDARAINLIGYEPSDLLGRTAYQFHCPRDVLICLQCHKQLIIGGSSVSGYYRFLARTGAWVWLYTHATLVYDTAHNPQYIVCRNYVVSQEEAERALSREKRGFERMKCLGFSLDTELPVAEVPHPGWAPTLAHVTKRKCADTDMLLERILSPPGKDISDNNYVRNKQRWRDVRAGIEADLPVDPSGQMVAQTVLGMEGLEAVHHPLDTGLLAEPLGKSMNSSGDSQFDVITASITSMFGIPTSMAPIMQDVNQNDTMALAATVLGPVVSHSMALQSTPAATVQSSGDSLPYVQHSSEAPSSLGNLTNAESSPTSVSSIFSTILGSNNTGHSTFSVSSSNCAQDVMMSTSPTASDSMDCLMEPLSSSVSTNGEQPIGPKQASMYNCLDNILSMLDSGQHQPDSSSASDLHDALTSGHSDPFLTDISPDLPDIDLIDEAALNSPKVAPPSMGELDPYVPSIPAKVESFSGCEMSQTSPESSSDSDSSGRQSLLRSLLDKEANAIEGPLTCKEWMLKQSFLKHNKDMKKSVQQEQNSSAARNGGSKRQRTMRSGIRKSVELPLPPSATAAFSKVRRRSSEIRRPTKELPLPPTAVSHSPVSSSNSGKAHCFSENILLKALSSPAASTKNELEELGLPEDLLDLAAEYGSSLGSDQAEALITELNEAANWEDGFGSLLDSVLTSKGQTSTNTGATCQYQSPLSSKRLPSLTHSLPHKALSSNVHSRKDLANYSMIPCRPSASQTGQVQQAQMGLPEQRGKPTMSLLRAAVTSPDMNSLIEQIPFGKCHHQSRGCTSQKPAVGGRQIFKLPSLGKPSPSRSPSGQVSRAVSTCVHSPATPRAMNSPASHCPASHNPASHSPASPRVSGSPSDSSNTEPVSVMIMRKEGHRGRRSRTASMQTDNKPDEVYPELEYSPSDTILYPSNKPASPRTARDTILYPSSTPASQPAMPASPRTSRISELERFLRASPPAVESCKEEKSTCSAPFLQMLLTGQLSRDNYQKLDQQLLERERRDASANL